MARGNKGSRVPVEKSTPISIGNEVDPDERYVPHEVAEQLADQLLSALARLAIDAETVVFSGYDDFDNEAHKRKAAGDFGTAELEADPYEEDTVPYDIAQQGAHEYFFRDASTLPDGYDGPFAYAGTGRKPVVGVYDLAKLRALTPGGAIEFDLSVYATPEQVEATKLLEFHPQYERPSE